MTENKRGKEEEEIIIHYEFLKLLSEKRLASLLSNNLLKHRWVRIKRKTTHLKILNFQMSFMRSWQAPIFWLAIFTFFFHVFPPKWAGNLLRWGRSNFWRGRPFRDQSRVQRNMTRFVGPNPWFLQFLL